MPGSEPVPGRDHANNHDHEHDHDRPVTRIAIAAPIRPSAGSGNDVTAARWAGHLNATGHRATVVPVDEEDTTLSPEVVAAFTDAEILIALHARRAEPAARWWAEHQTHKPLVVGLAGTDLYRDLPDNAKAAATVERADALIVLQAEAADRVNDLNPTWGAKTNVIYQSTSRTVPDRQPAANEFRVVVLAHLRQVKDPLLTARAAALLPEDSRVMVHHGGRAHDEMWQTKAEHEAAHNPRYRWHGELDGDAALHLLASAHVLACTSLSEGGANVVTEALAVGVPIIGTRIGGNIGLLGEDHPGLFPVGNADAMAVLLGELETDPAALAELAERSARQAPLIRPETERAALADLIEQVTKTT